MIEAQIERLSAEEQRALEGASIAGVLFSARVAAAAIDMVPEYFEDQCESLARRHRIVSSAEPQHFPDGGVFQRYEFAHALYREVLYRRQTPLRRAKLHRRIGERLEALFAQQLSEVGSELAYHFEQSSDWSRTVKYLQLAADADAQRYAAREAATLLQHALTFISKLPEAEREVTEIGILEKLAMIYAMSFDAHTQETYETLVARAAQYDLVDVEVHTLIEMAFFLSWTNTQRGLEVLDRALQISGRQSDPMARATSHMRCSYLRIWADAWNHEDAVVCRNAMSEIRQAGDPLALAPRLIDYSNLLFWCSEYRESHCSAVEGLAVLTAGSNGNPCANLPQSIGAWIVYLDLLHMGNWGEACREMESAIAALIKNANDWYAQAMRVWHAWLHIHAMDFSGALEICESAARLGLDAWSPPDQRLYLAIVGTAEVALGDHERALQHLSLARHEMDRQHVVNDWYSRMPLESAFTELWLAKGDLAQARAQGERFLQATLATAERTWQALAWEANARVAMAEGDIKRAQECIAKALSTMEGFEVPLAAWRVHATAAELHTLAGNKKSAKPHREISRATILKLADSLLPDEEALRKTFLAAPTVSRVLKVD